MSKKLLIGLLFLANSAQAGFVGVRLLGVLGVAASGSKVAQKYQQQKFQKTRLTVQDYTDLKESFGETWYEWRRYPKAAKIVIQTFKKYRVNIKQFLIYVDSISAFNSEIKVFGFEEELVKKVEINNKNQNFFKFVVSHELGHLHSYLDNPSNIVVRKFYLDGVKKNDAQKKEEQKADLFCNDLNAIEAAIKYFENEAIIERMEPKNNDLQNHDHPTYKQRLKYLKIKLNEMMRKQKQFEEKNLMAI